MKLQSLIIFGVLNMCFLQCSSTKQGLTLSDTIAVDKQTNPKAYYQHWVAGVRGGGSGTDVYIHKSLLGSRAVDSIYFQNKVAKIRQPKNTSEFYLASFSRVLNQLKEGELEADVVTEDLPEASFPFNLSDTEAIISYLVKGDTKYLKLINIIEKPGFDYPSAPKH